MFTSILVPLDGSKLAETALVPAVSIAKTLGAPITLLHIIEKDAPQEVHSEHHLTMADEAGKYLKNLAERSSSADVSIDTHVHTVEVNDVAASIILHANEEFNPDLIVMCAHGKSGIRDMVFGNIAQQVLAGGKTPLLLTQPQSSDSSSPFILRRIIVPLDSESIHDQSLQYAQVLGRAYNAEIYLLTVIPTMKTLKGEKAAISSMLPVTAKAFLDLQEETAREHLQTHLDEFLAADFHANAEIGRGDPSEVIVSTAARVRADIILLSTHSRAGISAFWSSSVAPNVLRKTHIPLLLVPIQ